MGKVQSIRIIFENYEVLKLDIEEFERIRIDRVSHWYEKLGGSRLDENLCAYGGLSFTLKPNVKGRFVKFRNPDEDWDYRKSDTETILWRLKENDITSIVLCYDDGTEKKIWVPFEPETGDCVNSVLQSSEVDAEGRMTVTIQPNRDEQGEVT